jgi:hypothetical protein
MSDFRSLMRGLAPLFVLTGWFLSPAWPVFSAEDDAGSAQDVNDPIWANDAFRKLMGDPVLYSWQQPFQLEIHLFKRQSDGRERHWREVFQTLCGWEAVKGGPSNGMIMLAENGLPFMLGSCKEGVVVSNTGGSPLNFVLRDAGYFRSLTEVATVQSGPLLGHTKQSAFWMELDHLLSQFHGSGGSTSGAPRSRTVRISGQYLSYAQFHITRERRARQFPITSLFLDCDTSPAHDHPLTVMLTNIYVIPERVPILEMGDGMFPRPIRDIHPGQGPADVFRDAGVKGKDAPDWLKQRLSWMDNPGRCDKVLSDASFQAAGKEILARLPATDGFSDQEMKRASRDLEELTSAARGEASRGIPRTASDALGDLASFLDDRVVSPVRIERWQIPVPTYLAGHERWRTANMLEARAGPELAARIHGAIRSVVLSATASLDLRLRALDLLGELGLPETSKELSGLEEALRGHGKQISRELDSMLSTVKVRTGVPTNDDIARIRKQIADKNTSAIVRDACLEALLLENETWGLEPLVYETVTRPVGPKPDFGTRCLFAAGLAEEGRDVLKRIIVERKPERLFKPALFLADTSIRPGDSQWQACQEVVERLAFDDRVDPDLRLKASQIAARSAEHTAFRAKYIRAILQSGNPRFIKALVLEPGYLGGMNADLYANDFAEAMASADPSVRTTLGTLFARWCPDDWPPQFDEAVEKVLRLLLADDSSESFKNSGLLFTKLPTRCLLANRHYVSIMVQRAKAKSDPSEFYWAIEFISIRCKLPLNTPYLPMFYKGSDEDERVIKEHRKELEAQVDAWLK